MDDFIGTLAVAALFNKAAAWLFGFTLAALAVGFIGYVIGANETMSQAVDRGLAEYCKHDGSRVWRGECSN